MQRIAIIGNGGGGKTTLARKLGQSLGLPILHVDSIQYQAGWAKTPDEECSRQLDAYARQDNWVIDGFGDDEVIERRLLAADTVVLVDLSLWTHFLWAGRRQWSSRHGQRRELPQDCPEFSFAHTWVLFKIMWRVHRDYTPWFRGLIRALPARTRVFHLRSIRELRNFENTFCN